jgi:hypothetical protein
VIVLGAVGTEAGALAAFAAAAARRAYLVKYWLVPSEDDDDEEELVAAEKQHDIVCLGTYNAEYMKIMQIRTASIVILTRDMQANEPSISVPRICTSSASLTVDPRQPTASVAIPFK